ncbi:hypothetical protein C1646_752452 [Rhizophagus diaphanus]|nr:hypothetical protein C1646_752452 [Rhizophagus diaphanus] [Rhizophagus sp. MUCL 43196]
MKNEDFKEYVIEEEKDMNYNKRIERIDEIIKDDQDFIDILKNITNEDEFKILIRCYNSKILLIEKGSDILLGIDEKVRKCLEYFMKNLRRGFEIRYTHSKLENIKEEKRKIRKFSELMKKENFETYEIDFIDEARKIEDLFYFNFENKFDWVKTLNFIILYQRGVNEIVDAMCPRCNNEIEDWYHVWKCERNEVELEEILYEAIAEYEEILMSDDKKEEVEILRNIKINFYEIMLTQSDILLGYSRIWELLRGVYNEKFDETSKKKEYKNVIEHLWSFCYDKYRTRIWVKRCDEVAEIEKDRGIDLKDKRKRKKKNRGGR